MNETEKNILDDISRKLNRGEDLAVFGPGHKTRHDSINHPPRVNRKQQLAMSLLAIDIVFVRLLVDNKSIFAFLLIAFIAINFVIIRKLVSNRTDNEFFALTNDRLIRITKSSTQTLALRENITKIERKEQTLVVTVSNQKFEITNLFESEKTH